MRERTPAGLTKYQNRRTLPASWSRKADMNKGKSDSAPAMNNLRLAPAQQVNVPSERMARSRQAVVSHDLYSYRRYKHWMNNLRASRDKI
jgi:hypothetical protein